MRRSSGSSFPSSFASPIESASDPLAETFAKLQLEYVHGCSMNTSETLRLMPMELTSVAQYAAAVCGQKRASA